MAMQQFNYGLGVGDPAPREGERRGEYDYANDERRFYLYENGAWRLERTITRLHMAQRLVFGINQGAPGNAFTFTTGNPSPEAIARAETLLLSHLSPEQLSQFKTNGRFEVIGGATKRTYRIDKHSWPGKNVTWMENGRGRVSYCAYPTGHAYLPVGDVMLAQKMALEDTEGEKCFTAMACWVDHVDGGMGGNGFVYGVRDGRMHIDNRNALRIDAIVERVMFDRLAPGGIAMLRDTSDDNAVPVAMMWGGIGLFLAGGIAAVLAQFIR